MTPDEHAEIKRIINDHKANIQDEIIELIELTKSVSLDASIGRLSRMDAINNKAINEKALRDKKQILKKLERAHERAENGETGTCLRCGGEIPFGRLKIMPYTTKCVKCA
ncbi:TraR/DksA family transcriptional regulator [Rhodohalobacter mucosus]|uniref:Conjugal transfer protein TraR n=1 Tax=Rhodohalobacter mucosus TaxID=2079485 RepID=A0A316TQL9_9BACT|nr:TraR/DksA C4-type zinc finger protein [Rhodohalobacter mucosus]PWN05539.1 conjugal transfer protein TraR [Rhodohalobacter mucosus]